MALTATMYHLRIDLSDVDRGVYEKLDLRLARHPSEAARYLFARALAYCLLYQEGLAFTRGLAASEEPALWAKTPDGRTQLWVEVGAPAAERLHKASKAAERVVVVTHHDPAMVKRALAGRTIHRAERIELYALEPPLLDALEGATGRDALWAVVHTGGELYVTVGAQTFHGKVSAHPLV
ncbi:MAG TPA: YaeQ family protein [Polyangiaceae bacterium]|nr:YaeQ family protein [Polyangiaceae bacterium]